MILLQLNCRNCESDDTTIDITYSSDEIQVLCNKCDATYRVKFPKEIQIYKPAYGLRSYKYD